MIPRRKESRPLKPCKNVLCSRATMPKAPEALARKMMNTPLFETEGGGCGSLPAPSKRGSGVRTGRRTIAMALGGRPDEKKAWKTSALRGQQWKRHRKVSVSVSRPMI